jgi:hypothetical protein
MRDRMWCLSILLPYLVATPVLAQNQPSVTSDTPVYVTRQDCNQLVAHHPAPDVTYQPGVDVHGRPVAPADLPGSRNLQILPDRVTFDLKVNPLAYGSRLSTSPGDKFANTAMTVARIEVDLLSGALRLNGQPLDSEQTRIVTEACRKAGYR